MFGSQPPSWARTPSPEGVRTCSWPGSSRRSPATRLGSSPATRGRARYTSCRRCCAPPASAPAHTTPRRRRGPPEAHAVDEQPVDRRMRTRDPPRPACDVALGRHRPVTRTARHRVLAAPPQWLVGLAVPVGAGAGDVTSRTDLHPDDGRHAARSQRPLPHVLPRVGAPVHTVAPPALTDPVLVFVHDRMMPPGYDTNA